MMFFCFDFRFLHLLITAALNRRQTKKTFRIMANSRVGQCKIYDLLKGEFLIERKFFLAFLLTLINFPQGLLIIEPIRTQKYTVGVAQSRMQKLRKVDYC